MEKRADSIQWWRSLRTIVKWPSKLLEQAMYRELFGSDPSSRLFGIIRANESNNYFSLDNWPTNSFGFTLDNTPLSQAQSTKSCKAHLPACHQSELEPSFCWASLVSWKLPNQCDDVDGYWQEWRQDDTHTCLHMWFLIQESLEANRWSTSTPCAVKLSLVPFQVVWKTARRCS